MNNPRTAIGFLGYWITIAMVRALHAGFGVLVGIVLLAVGTRAAEPAGPDNLVWAVKVLPDKAVDSSSLKAIVDTVTRDCTCNDDKIVGAEQLHARQPLPPRLSAGRPLSALVQQLRLVALWRAGQLADVALQPDSRLELAWRQRTGP